MKVRTLQLEENQMARLRVESQMARISVDSSLRRIKEIDQEPAQMMVTRQNPSIEVDNESLWNNIGLKDNAVLMSDYADETASALEQANKTVRSNGEYIVSMPRGSNPIAKIARRRVTSTPPPAIARGASDPTVSIKGNPGSISINWSIQDVKIVWDDYQAPVIRLDPKPYVNIELAQDARLAFRIVEQSVPPEAGRTIDQEA